MVTFSGERLRELREGSGKTKGQLSLEADLSRATVDTYESGKSIPSVVAAFKLADVLKCDVRDFMEGLREDVAAENSVVAAQAPPVDHETFVRMSVAKYESGQKITLEEERAAGEFYWRTGSTGLRPAPAEEPLPGDIDEPPPLPTSFQPFTRVGNREEERWGAPVVQPTPEEIVEDEPPLDDEGLDDLAERERRRLERATPSPTGPVRQPWSWTPSIFDQVADDGNT